MWMFDSLIKKKERIIFRLFAYVGIADYSDGMVNIYTIIPLKKYYNIKCPSWAVHCLWKTMRHCCATAHFSIREYGEWLRRNVAWSAFHLSVNLKIDCTQQQHFKHLKATHLERVMRKLSKIMFHKINNWIVENPKCLNVRLPYFNYCSITESEAPLECIGITLLS